MKNLAIKSILSATAAAFSLGLVMNAKAGQLDETFVNATAVPTVAVSYSSAELSTEEGRATVERRIRRAAEQVCGSLNYREAGGLSRYRDIKDCHNQAISQAMSQLGVDQVASATH